VAPVIALAQDAMEEQKNARPKDGDVFVFVSGATLGQMVTPVDIAEGARPVFVWPMDPANNIIRDGSRLNQLLLVRLDPAALDEVTKADSADGIVAYSAVCTHQLCPVSGWNEEKQALHCPCHQSDFDPRQNGMKISGPAQRSLPALPVKIVDGTLQAAGTFVSAVGRGTG
jgi:Rieske Fe-S protein